MKYFNIWKKRAFLARCLIPWSSIPVIVQEAGRTWMIATQASVIPSWRFRFKMISDQLRRPRKAPYSQKHPAHMILAKADLNVIFCWLLKVAAWQNNSPTAHFSDFRLVPKAIWLWFAGIKDCSQSRTVQQIEYKRWRDLIKVSIQTVTRYGAHFGQRRAFFRSFIR